MQFVGRTAVRGDVRNVAAWLRSEFELGDIGRGHEFVVPFKSATGWEDVWENPNYLPDNGTIKLTKAEADESGERITIRVYGVHCVWRNWQVTPPQPEPINTPLYVFDFVGVRPGETEVRYVAHVDSHSRSMQEYPQAVLQRLVDRFRDPAVSGVDTAGEHLDSGQEGRADSDTVERARAEDLAGTSTDALGTRYIFRQDGGIWEVAYREGKTFRLKHLIGLSYIHLLLERPGEEIGVIDMERAVGNTGQAKAQTDLEQEELAADDPGYSEPMADKAAMREYRDRLIRIAQERQVATESGDVTALERLNEEVEWIEKTIRGVTGRRGKPRRFSAVQDKTRIRVAQAIWYAIAQIESRDPALSLHFKSGIITGNRCVYRPSDESPKWRFK